MIVPATGNILYFPVLEINVPEKIEPVIIPKVSGNN
jgi:hypothetical protein